MSKLIKNDSFKSYINLSMAEKTIDDVLEQNNSTNKSVSSPNQNIDNSQTLIKFQQGSEVETNENVKQLRQQNSNECNRNRLCGYLKKLKLGSRNIGKTFKNRWFVLAEESCTLLYFTTAKDVVPLGEINIGKSVFTFLTDEAQNRINVFEIRSPDKVVLLQAEDHQTMMYWIQNLQIARKKYFYKMEPLNNSGLIPMSQGSNTINISCSSLVQNIERPNKTVGESTANMKVVSRSKSLKDISLANWKVELQNKFATIKNNKNRNCIIECENDSNNNININNNNDSTANSNNIINENAKVSNIMTQNIFTLLKNSKVKPNNNINKNHNQNLINKTNQNMTMKNKDSNIYSASVDHITTNSHCSGCNKLKEDIEKVKMNETMLAEELSAHQVITANLNKTISKLTQQLESWKASNEMKTDESNKNNSSNINVSNINNMSSEDECSDGTICNPQLKDGSRNVDLEELILCLQADIVTKTLMLEDLKKKLETKSNEIESLQLNLNIKDEMLIFLSDTCQQQNMNKIQQTNNTSIINVEKLQQNVETSEQDTNNSVEDNKYQQKNESSLQIDNIKQVEKDLIPIFDNLQQMSDDLQQMESKSSHQTLNNSSHIKGVDDTQPTSTQQVCEGSQINVVKQLCNIFEPNSNNKKRLKNIPIIMTTNVISAPKTDTTSTTMSTTSSVSSETSPNTATSSTSSMTSTLSMPSSAVSTKLILNDDLISFDDNSLDLQSINNMSNNNNINTSNNNINTSSKNINTSNNNNTNSLNSNINKHIWHKSSSFKIANNSISANSSMSNIPNPSTSEPWYVYEDASWQYHQDERLAYKTQNKMLNQEILDLNEFLKRLEDKLDDSQICVTKLEASLNHMNRKFLKCYLELTDLCTNEVAIITSDKLKQVFEDSMEVQSMEDIIDKIRSKHGPVYDQYGFERALKSDISVTEISDSNEALKGEMNKLRKSQQDMTLCLKWETMLISLERCLTFRNKEVKTMIRDGVPNQFRARLWKVCIDVLIKDYRTNVSINSYSSLLDMITSKTVVTPFANQIELDLLRTLPNNKNFSTYTCTKITSLRNILLAFSIHNPDIGYCQGLNRIAAILLLVLSEEEAFWGLVAMVEVVMPTNYYNRTLMAAHADQRVLKDIVADKLPTLFQHFMSLNFDPNLFTFSWFLTIYVDNLPVSTFLRIWDTFLYEGNKVLFRYALAIMKFYESKILSFKTSTELNMFIRTMCENLTDVNKLSQIAFNELNPFPMRIIRNKRTYHLNKLSLELAELERLRQTFECNLTSSQQHDDDDDQQHKKLELKYSSDADEIA